MEFDIGFDARRCLWTRRAAEGPLSIRLDELSVYSLQRLAAVLVATQMAAADRPAGSDAPPTADVAAVMALACEALGEVVIHNGCPAALLVRQLGGGGAIGIASDSTRWRSGTTLCANSKFCVTDAGTKCWASCCSCNMMHSMGH